MGETLKLIIMPDGKAYTINPIEGDNDFSAMASCKRTCVELCGAGVGCVEWIKAEAQRKSYEVLPETNKHNRHACFDEIIPPIGMCGGVDSPYYEVKYEPGTLVEAEVIDENTVRVVKII